MANTYFMIGKANWAKILGEPVDNYNKDGKEWTMDFTPDEDGMATLKEIGLNGRLKNKGDDRGDFLQLRQKATRRDGSANRPITVVDAMNRPWDPNTKIGNDSLVEVKINVVDYGPGKSEGIYPQAVRVLHLVPYERQEFAPLPPESEYVQEAESTFAKDFGLEDDEFPETE